MKRTVFRDGNGSSIILVEGLGQYVPTSEYSELLTEIQELHKDIDALKARNEALEEQNFNLQCFSVDVIRCLKTLAFEHNHVDIPRYMGLAKQCMDEIASRSNEPRSDEL